MRCLLNKLRELGKLSRYFSLSFFFTIFFTRIYQDAFILATLLGHRLTRLQNVHQALSIYDSVRRPIATEVAHRSLVNGRLFGLQYLGLDADMEPERLPEIGEAIKDNWKWSK